MKHRVHYIAIHVAGQDTILADALSRIHRHEPGVGPSSVTTFTPYSENGCSWRWTSLPPGPRPNAAFFFCSRAVPDKIAWGCFSVALARSPFYGFSPFGVLHEVVVKLKAGRAACILLDPYWPRRVWLQPCGGWPRKVTEPCPQQ